MRPHPASGCRAWAPAGKGGAEALAQGARASPTETIQGVSTQESMENRAWAVGFGYGKQPHAPRAVGGREETLPALLGRGHLCGPAAGWGGAAPLCGRAGLEPAFPQSHALCWEGLGAATPSNARCLRTSRGPRAVMDCGAGKKDSRTADRSRAPPQPPFLAQYLSLRSFRLRLGG